jgi:hypothetical protein
MLNIFLSSLNYWALIVSGIAFWIIGAVWFGALFGKTWSAEVQKHGVVIKKPTSTEMGLMSVKTLVGNFVVAFGCAFIVFTAHTYFLWPAIKLGVFTGLTFSVATLWIASVWEKRSTKLVLIDAGYPLVGITVCTVILSLWR